MNNLRPLLKKLLVPGGVALAAKPIVLKEKDEDEKPKKGAVRPSELPIYVDPPKRVAAPEPEGEVTPFEEFVGTVRRELGTVADEVNNFTNMAFGTINHHLDMSNEMLDYLKEEENVLPRSGAIALGGLTGLVFGLRGGFFKRLIYMSAGAGGMAALCYPKEAEEYFNESLVLGQRYALVGYHLATSVIEDLTGTSLGSSGEAPKKEEEKKKASS